MREITDHHDGHGLAESIKVFAMDEPVPGGANHDYVAHTEGMNPERGECALDIQFQKGPRNESGSMPGVLDSVLLAIVADRMLAFQVGPFACRENALVLTKVEEALHWLKHRADARARRGVLGKNEK